MYTPSAISSVYNGFLEAIAPARCIRCLREGSWHCNACIRLYRPYTQSCIVCEQPHPSGRTCTTCREDTHLTGLLSAGAYATPYLKRGISWLKFKNIQPVAAPLAFLTLPTLLRIAPLSYLQDYAVFIPIPLHARRMRQRGFNQAQEIAEALVGYTHIPTTHILTRTQATHAQARLPKHMRRENVAHAFAADEIPPHTRIVIVIDDVTTSGSTITSAAQALHARNPGFSGQLWGLTIARG